MDGASGKKTAEFSMGAQHGWKPHDLFDTLLGPEFRYEPHIELCCEVNSGEFFLKCPEGLACAQR
ncbi:hypothetical protein M3Y99_00456900 [Aphelenchoides fujianensis]|nr:hypothetical protein M3Y99_00456900 [Aphelenchoides fujianensis]